MTLYNSLEAYFGPLTNMLKNKNIYNPVFDDDIYLTHMEKNILEHNASDCENYITKYEPNDKNKWIYDFLYYILYLDNMLHKYDLLISDVLSENAKFESSFKK